MRISKGQSGQLGALGLARQILNESQHYNRDAVELARRVEAINIALLPVAAEYLMDKKLPPSELRKVVNAVIHILDNTKDTTL